MIISIIISLIYIFIIIGPHDAVEDALQDKQRKDQAISDRFLLAFAEIVKSDWTLIGPHFFPNYLLEKKNSQDVIKQLREWKEEKKPSYRMLSRWLNQVIFKPFEHNGEEMIEGKYLSSIIVLI